MLKKQRFTQWLALGALSLSLLPLGAAQAATTPPVGAPFRTYYNQHQGIRVLGNPLAEMQQTGPQAFQYFEKGRIEDHSNETNNPDWKFMYGRLTAEMMDKYPSAAANATDLSYKYLKESSDLKMPSPAGFKGGVKVEPNGGVFVPYDSQLRPAPGYYIPPFFWNYMNRKDLFPGGWLHDLGLPMTPIMVAETVKNGQKRGIQMQAFERAILTFDPSNPREWQVERGNIGSDMFRQLQDTQPNQNAAAYVTGRTLNFLRRAGENPQKAEIEFADMLSQRARTVYVGGQPRGSDWINNVLMTKQYGGTPQCPTGDEPPCRVIFHKLAGDRAYVKVIFDWVGEAEALRLLTFVRENGDWKLDDVVGADTAWDERLGGISGQVSRFFFEWQAGDIQAARSALSPELQKQAQDSAQLATLMGVRTTPRVVFVTVEREISKQPRKGIIRVSLAVPGTEMVSRQLEVVEKDVNDTVHIQITRVMP